MGLLTPELVQKETIPHCHFDRQEKLSSPLDQKIREDKIFRAMIMGNTYRKKALITFETVDGVKQVETTVWATTDANVILKNGITIPQGCIVDIEI